MSNDDLPARLRKRGHYLSDGAGGSDGTYRPQTFKVDPLCAEAADEIERLRAGLQALYDATEVADVVYDVAVWDETRAAAGVVLGGDNEAPDGWLKRGKLPAAEHGAISSIPNSMLVDGGGNEQADLAD